MKPYQVLIFAIIFWFIGYLSGLPSDDTLQLQQQRSIIRINELSTKVDVLIGQMKTYQNLPVDLRARMALLETRYDSLTIFQREITNDK